MRPSNVHLAWTVSHRMRSGLLCQWLSDHCGRCCGGCSLGFHAVHSFVRHGDHSGRHGAVAGNAGYSHGVPTDLHKIDLFTAGVVLVTAFAQVLGMAWRDMQGRSACGSLVSARLR